MLVVITTLIISWFMCAIVESNGFCDDVSGKDACNIQQNRQSGDNTRIFAIFVCGPDPTQNMQDPNSKNLRGQTYRNLLQNSDDNNESWREYMIYKNDFPSQEDILLFSGIIITGSKHDAHTNDAEWKLKLQEIIKDIFHNQRQIKLLGICFGHQMIIHSLRNNEKDEIVVGRNTKKDTMELGLLSVTLTDKFDLFWNKYNIKINDELLWVHQAHNDVVFKLPEEITNNGNASILAYSQYTDIEMYHIGQYILGVQGHPEFTTEYLSNAIVENQKYMRLTDNELQRILETMKLNEPSLNEWQCMLKAWLRFE
eukprot:39597_1